MSYTIVTAWYDVREKENHPNKDDTTNQYFCSPKWYFDSAKLLFEKEFPMVIFTEPKCEAQILEARPKHLHGMTRFIYRDYDELAYYSYYTRYEECHKKNPIKNVTQEKFTALYKFIVNQKVNFVKDTIMMNPFQTEKFAWMDMRLHCVYDMSLQETNEVMRNMPNNRVKLMQMSNTFAEDIYGRHDFYSWTRGKVAAGFFGGSREPLLKFIDACQKEFLAALNEEMTPTDEMIYSYVIAQTPHLFEPYVGEYGFCLKNLVRTRGCHHLVFPFLQKAFDKGNHAYTRAICDGIRSGYNEKEIDLSADDIYKAWYYNYVAHFWIQNRDECRNILNELYHMARKREDVKEKIRGMIDFLRTNIQYMGDENLLTQLEEFR